MDLNKNNFVTPWLFRDGREYIVILKVGESPKSIGVIITDKITSEEWSCHYDLKMIEDMTSRTGSFKQFDIFVAMIKSALLKNTDSVTLELMTLADLKLLRNKIHRVGLTVNNESAAKGLQGNEDTEKNTRKKYLIVTYTSEFDNTHYPISLNYSGSPNPIAMQNNIQRLMAEVTHLRTVNSELSSELKRFNNPDQESVHVHNGKEKKKDFTLQNISTVILKDLLAESQGHCKTKDDQYEYKFDIQSIQNLMSSIKELEENIVVERVKFKERIEKLVLENNALKARLEDFQLNESNLKTTIEKLERDRDRKQIQPWRRTSSLSRSRPSPSSARPTFYARSSSLGTRRDSGRRGHIETELVHKKPLGMGGSVRSRSSSPRFDPTAYVKSKKLKDEKIQKERMARIESRFQNRLSMEGRGRPMTRGDRIRRPPLPSSRDTSITSDRSNSINGLTTSVNSRNSSISGSGSREPWRSWLFRQRDYGTTPISPGRKKSGTEIGEQNIRGTRQKNVSFERDASRRPLTDLSRETISSRSRIANRNRDAGEGNVAICTKILTTGNLNRNDSIADDITNGNADANELDLEQPLKAIQAFINATKISLHYSDTE